MNIIMNLKVNLKKLFFCKINNRHYLKITLKGKNLCKLEQKLTMEFKS